MTTYTDVQKSELLAAEFPMLGAAALETGGIANQNRGTLGGNIANASPAADTPPALLAYDAELELVSLRGPRRVPYDRFHSGYKKMDLAGDELIRAIHLPRRSGSRRHFYRKVGTRRAQAISKVCLAAAIEIDRGAISYARLALGSVAPTVVRARNTEAAITGRPLHAETVKAARTAVVSDISPIDDIRSTAHYRATVAGNLIEELLTSIS
jgi:CO/xanthine dehydrogenase FAD-binding subunit